MGRSGGRSGGGRSRSGGFRGGRRSSGGFSGGGRSSSRSVGGGYSRSIRTGPIFIHRAPRYGGGGRYSGGGVGSVVATLCVMLVIVAAVWFYVRAGSGGSIQSSTYEREKLPASAVTETSYYTDEGGWFSNPAQLESGMRRFYQETGVQPYLYLLANGSVTSVSQLTTMAEELYPRLFTDEGHFLLVFCDDGNGSYNCGYTVGSQAKTVMDEEAIAILADYLDRYYNDYSISEEEIFSKTFEDTGERIMTVTKSPLVMIAVCVAVIVVAVVIFVTLKKQREQREREQQRTEEILRTPLETFGDQKIEDLAEKYENPENPS